MKIIHIFNEQKVLLTDKQVDDNYQPKDNESFDLPALVTYAPNYKPIERATNATPEQQLLMLQSKEIASLKTLVMKQNQDSAKLAASYQDQTQRIKQLQQMMMIANQQQAVAKSKEEK